jgi:uncharacterized protein involved in cysteine biosynthesis
MSLGTLALVWLGLAALRAGFLALHFSNLESLWYDFERRGPVFRLARGLDLATLIAFGAAATWTLWGQGAQTSDRLSRVFLAWLGFLLLERLSLHRFPRTNVPGALRDAQIALAVNLFLAALGALAATLVAWLYFRWLS